MSTAFWTQVLEKCIYQSLTSNQMLTMHKKISESGGKKKIRLSQPSYFFLVFNTTSFIWIWQVLLCKLYPHIIMILAFPQLAYERQRSKL